MRLDDHSRDIIKREVAAQLGAQAVVRLFGSRLDDTQRGGDIDLLIDPRTPLANRIRSECQLAASLFIKLGGRKVDVLITADRTPPPVIQQQAMLHGIVL